MKSDLIDILRMTGISIAVLFAFLLALVLGLIPFIVSFILGLSIIRIWVGYALAILATVSVTLYSSAQPEVFRFGNTDLMIHDGIFIAGLSTLIVNLVKNLFFAHLGVMTGIALRQGYQTKKIEQDGTSNGG